MTRKSGSKGIGKAELEKLYFVERLSGTEIGIKLKVNQSTISRLVKKFGLPRRGSLTGSERKGRIRQERIKSIEGYWMVRVPGHRRSDHQGYVKEHMVIWERHHGLQLASGSVVHHIDGDVTNNLVENLRMFSNSEHSRFHAFARRLAGIGCKACPKDKVASSLVAWDARVASAASAEASGQEIQMEFF